MYMVGCVSVWECVWYMSWGCVRLYELCLGSGMCVSGCVFVRLLCGGVAAHRAQAEGGGVGSLRVTVCD